MWNYPEKYDVIVIGAGHAGCEAAHASAKIGAKTLLLTMNLDTIAKMSCNPSIGGTAKGHIVREIDALGGIMGIITDKTCIHSRLLNRSKGPSVRSPRAQIDKVMYHLEMKKALEETENLFIKQATVTGLVVENNQITKVQTQEQIQYLTETVIITSGTFMQGEIFIGHQSFTGGRLGDPSCKKLSPYLQDIGFDIGKLKTGTPARIHKRSINFDATEIQHTETDVRFSFELVENHLEKQPCFITYTTDETKKIIQEDLKKSALFSGKITGKGPRYCPSIEDKIVRFSDKSRHQLFLEPEGNYTNEYYINGLSTSMPIETQKKIISSVIGLENAEVMRWAYAIEYDYIKSSQLQQTLETKLIKGLYFAGQVNGTTGYEEAAAQGLIAGINAALKTQKRPSFTLSRSECYIGVMIDDLITKELFEPYRMFTSRAEHRLLLRQDNADLRLTEKGFQAGLISKQRYEKFLEKKEAIQSIKENLETYYFTENNQKVTFKKWLARPDVSYQDVLNKHKSFNDLGKDTNEQIEYDIKYEGYIKRQQKEIEKLQHLDNIKIPLDFSYEEISGLRNEAKEKLKLFSPPTLGAASRILGVSIADISILMIALKKQKTKVNS
ncbi:MAG TPA: tRNA uridine-5-carboxymethylaminomethyl(34) synthesis enzyme MnmG [Chlamydiales bacterium]|nr:tRNA uridine-5-carboxymethylaminomethyl(34) synthesis enzyme MnmG [Chlamydiales bacterium]